MPVATIAQPTTAVAAVIDRMRRAGFEVTEHPPVRGSFEWVFDNRAQGDAAVFGAIRVGVTSGRFTGGNVTEQRDGRLTGRALATLADVRSLTG